MFKSKTQKEEIARIEQEKLQKVYEELVAAHPGSWISIGCASPPVHVWDDPCESFFKKHNIKHGDIFKYEESLWFRHGDKILSTTDSATYSPALDLHEEVVVLGNLFEVMKQVEKEL